MKDLKPGDRCPKCDDGSLVRAVYCDGIGVITTDKKMLPCVHKVTGIGEHLAYHCGHCGFFIVTKCADAEKK